MTESNLESSAPCGGISPPRLFHNNLHYREVIATLRYGIEARKGLIVLSGDSGTGKTTLIHRLLEELDPSVTCILESDPAVDFTDLLRSILRHLSVEGDIPDSLSMADRCKAILRAERDRGHIVCLIIDNAQQLDELTLEYLMESFFPADSENSDKNILQVVLVGRPPVREKLLHPWLRPLNPQLGLVCEVQPLSEKDLGPYIEDQLRGWQFPADALDGDALRLIFEYTSGTPRLVNEFCGRAVQIAEASQSRRITRETVTNAAREAGVSEVWRSRKTKNLTMDLPSERKQREESFDFEVSEAHTTDMLMQTFLQDTPRRRRWFGGEGRWGGGVRVLLPLLLIVGIAAWLQRDILGIHVGQLTEGVKAITDSADFSSFNKNSAEFSASNEIDPEVVAAPAKAAPEPIPPPKTPRRSPRTNGITSNRPSPQGQSDERPGPAAENIAAAEPKPAAKPPPSPPSVDEGQGSRAEPLEARSKQLEAQVQRAIQIRAINGVEVSVANGTAILEGRVASERQKRAAERAANSVSGVQRVRNRLVVG